MTLDHACIPKEIASGFNRTPLFRFLYYCEKSDLEKKILDCGAGGVCPPLALFSSFGYKCVGIDIDNKQIGRAEKFSLKHNLDISYLNADMRSIPFEDDMFSFAYTYNSIFHMKKSDIRKSLNEMQRVVAPGGLIYFNILTTKDDFYGEGEKIGHGEYVRVEGEDTVIHSYFDHDESADLISDFILLCKVERNITSSYRDDVYTAGFIDYFLKMP